MRNPKKILCPVDLSKSMMEVVSRVGDFARAFEAEVTLLHVEEPPLYRTPPGIAAEASLPGEFMDVALAQREAVGATLKSVALGPQLEGLGVHIRQAMGSPAVVIVELANEEQFDLIALGTHGHTGLRHMLLGSVAERVVRMARCPVLTLPVH